MSGPTILAPVVRGSGATVLHQELERVLPSYRLCTYSRWLELFPPLMLGVGRGTKPSLVHTGLEYGWWFRRSGIPLVVTAHNYVLDRSMRPYVDAVRYLHYRTDLRWFARLGGASACAVAAVSAYVARRLREDLGLSLTPRVIYNGVDTGRFRPFGPAAARGPFRILYCGNLNARKRPHLLAPLAAALGSGFEILYTRGLGPGAAGPVGAGGGAARLTCVGAMKHGDMTQLYNRVDALFMPSVREGFGLCVAEAMACGLPVVACNASALPELVIDGQGGYLCAVDAVQAYAAALRRIAADPASARRMGEFNRERVRQLFTLERMGKDYRLLFEEVLDKGPVSGGG